jgi:hypothetical protein
MANETQHIRRLFGTAVSLLDIPGLPSRMNAAKSREMRRTVGYHLSRISPRFKSPRKFTLTDNSGILSWNKTFTDQMISRGFIDTNRIKWFDLWTRYVYKQRNANVASRRLNELMRNHASPLEKQEFDAMVQQLKGEDKLVANTTQCTPINVIIYSVANANNTTIHKNTAINTTLPEKQINRKSIINSFEGVKMYPRIRVEHRHVTKDEAKIIASVIGIGKFKPCEYSLDIIQVNF